MVYILKYFSNFIPFLFVIHFASGVTINATIDQNKITLDDVFELKVEAIDGSELPQVDMSPIKKNFIVINGPSQQTNISWVNGKMTSIYRWEGAVAEDDEIAVLLKTRRNMEVRVTERVKELHSYDMPCVIGLPITGGNPDFIHWLNCGGD